MAVFLAAPSQGALTSASVLVLYNGDSADGIELANYYAQVHPGVQLLGLSGVTTDEQVTADYYLNVIRPQILPALNSSINAIVTTKGLPLRINVTESNPGAPYTDPFGVTRTVGSGWWKPYSSLESELTRIDEISTWQQMGDQTYYSQTGKPGYPQPSCNPYYKATASFNYSDYAISGYGGMRLSARLDGFSTAQVKNSIDRAQKAFLLLSPGSQYVVMDDDPNSVGQDRINNLKTVLDGRSQAYVYDNTDAAITTASRPVIGYVSHGTNDGAGGLEPGYIAAQLNFRLAHGAVFHTHESFNAYTFRLPENQAQGLVAEWLAIGGTAGVGNVQEPSSGTPYEANEDKMFQMLLDGYTWGEAAWSSLQQLSYVNTVVGDPLMVWKKAIAGDANLDGYVDGLDWDIWRANIGSSGADVELAMGDFNLDGAVDGADLDILRMNMGSSLRPSGLSIGGTGLSIVPEPGTLVLLGTGLLGLVCYAWKRKYPGNATPERCLRIPMGPRKPAA
jgi:uncharacterized protein (TIGR03790 family)